MTISAESKVWTDEAFMALSKDGHRYELVNGELLDMGNSGMEHGEINRGLSGWSIGYLCAPKQTWNRV